MTSIFNNTFPPCDKFDLTRWHGKMSLTITSDHGPAVRGDGVPTIPKEDQPGEKALSYWRLFRASLTIGGLGRNGDAYDDVGFGEVGLILTNLNLRGAFLKGASRQIGSFQAGQGFDKRGTVLGFTWPLDEIERVDVSADRRNASELRVHNLTHVAQLWSPEANAANNSCIVKGFGLRNRAGRLGDEIIAQAAKVQRGIPGRAELAERALAGVRASEDGWSTAWFVEGTQSTASS